MAGGQRQLRSQTTSVRIYWQQGQEEGDKDVEWVWLCGGCVAPPIQENEVICGVGGVVQWPC